MELSQILGHLVDPLLNGLHLLDPVFGLLVHHRLLMLLEITVLLLELGE